MADGRLSLESDNNSAAYRIIVVGVAGFGLIYWLSHHHPKPPPGALVREVPQIQPVTSGDPSPWHFKNYLITPLAKFNIRGRVLSTERYHFGRSAELSPIDLAVGWRGMSDSTYLDKLDISQGSRWFFYSYKEAPLAPEMIATQSKNIHVIPANGEIASQVESVAKDQLFRADGYLVQVKGDGGFSWSSALSLDGTGESSCLLFWVEHFEIEG